MRLATWNVNSIRARVELVAEWLADQQPDVCCLQETKCRDEVFPSETFADLGYAVAHHGVDQWNGVAILSRVGLDDVRRGFGGCQRAPFDEARLIAASCGGVRVLSVYVPNGRSLDDPHYLYKLVWLERLRGLLLADDLAAQRTVVAGDFNVAPSDLDIYDPKRWRHRTHASPPERAAIEALLALGFHDLAREHAPHDRQFTWWNYRSNLENDRGLRLDLVLGSADVRSALRGVTVDRMARSAPRPSDHAPVVAELRW